MPADLENSMPVKVSVVVPVYNPGPFIERCVASLVNQTMPSSDYEVLFVDDGSTDDTPARLDQLAAEHPHVRVMHEEASGWAGRPRNVGIAAARGDYVQFVDQDDALGLEALERLYEMGARNNADMVLGKVTSDFRIVPLRVFRKNVDRCTIRDWPLIASLTPHKMLRREFLLEHGILFPEGRRRLEDQLFMVKAYLAAKVVSIVGDYPCYYYLRRDDRNNAGNNLVEPAGYYANLREVLDAVEAGTDPGELRNEIMRRFYRGEMLKRLSEPAVLRYSAARVRKLYAEIRPLALERFPDEVPDGLPVVSRIRSVLVREDRLDDLVEFAARCGTVRTRAQVQPLGWTDGPTLRLRVEAGLRVGLASGLVVGDRDGRLVLDSRLTSGLVDEAGADCSADLPVARAEVVLRERDSKLEWFASEDLPATLEPAGGVGRRAQRLVFSGIVEIDPETAAGGAALGPGRWDVFVRIRAFGVTRGTRARSLAAADKLPLPALLRRPDRLVIPRVTALGKFRLIVVANRRSLAAAAARRGPLDARLRRGRLVVDLPFVTGADSKPAPARVTLVGSAATTPIHLPAKLEPRGHRLVLTAALAGGQERQSGSPRAGRYELYLGTGTGQRDQVRIGSVVVRRRDRWSGLIGGLAGVRDAAGAAARRRRSPRPPRR